MYMLKEEVIKDLKLSKKEKKIKRRRRRSRHKTIKEWEIKEDRGKHKPQKKNK